LVKILKKNSLKKGRRKMVESEKLKNKIYLRDIKSSYIIKAVFLFLYGKQKLNMIIYNKALQKMLLIEFGVIKE